MKISNSVIRMYINYVKAKKVNSIYLEVLSLNLLANEGVICDILYLVGLDDETIMLSDFLESFLDVISVNASTAIVNQDRSEA